MMSWIATAALVAGLVCVLAVLLADAAGRRSLRAGRPLAGIWPAPCSSCAGRRDTVVVW